TNDARAALNRAYVEQVDRQLRPEFELLDKHLQITCDDSLVAAKNARKAAVVDGRALDFDAQIDSLGRRVLADFCDAYDRARMAAFGLAQIYGYPDEYDSPEYLPTATTVDLSLLDGTVLWTRKAIRWMAQFAQYDQSFTYPLSINQSLKA